MTFVLAAFPSTVRPKVDSRRLDRGGKVLLPARALSSLLNRDGTMFGDGSRSSSQPVLFRFSSATRSVVGGVLEFTSREGEAVLPMWMFAYLQLEPHAYILVDVLSRIPKAEMLVLRPRERAFVENLSDPKVVLEDAMGHYAALSIGQPIEVHHNDCVFTIDVVDLRNRRAEKVAAVIVAVDSEVKVDFEPPLDMSDKEAIPTGGKGVVGGGAKGDASVVFGSFHFRPPSVVPTDPPSSAAAPLPGAEASRAEGSKPFQAFQGGGRTAASDGETQAEMRARFASQQGRCPPE